MLNGAKQYVGILVAIVITAVICIGGFLIWNANNKTAAPIVNNSNQNINTDAPVTPEARAQIEARNRQELEKMFNNGQ